jgi:hypothetical protein
MTISLKLRIGDLLSELLTHTLIVLAALQPAGAITALLLQAFSDLTDHLFVFV